jgi:hypothetical protein
MTDAREDRTDIEVRWSDDVHIIILNVASTGEASAEVYLDPDEGRALGQTLIRAADTKRRTGPIGTRPHRDDRWLAVLEEEAAQRGLPPGPGVHQSVRFTTRYLSGSQTADADRADDSEAPTGR